MEAINNKKISFEDTSVAFLGKTDRDLIRSRGLFKIFGSPLIVKILSKITLFSLKIGLPIKWLILKTIYKQFCAAETLDESKNLVNNLSAQKVYSILDYSVEGTDCIEDIVKTKNEIIKIIIFGKKSKSIPYTCLKFSGIFPAKFLTQNDLELRSGNFENETRPFVEIFHSICYTSLVNNVPIFIDAEESWIQNSIDNYVEIAMKKYNTNKPVVLTTLQMYRWDRLDYLNRLISNARSENYFIGIKLVRGAYHEKENNRALELGYKSPIHINKHNVDSDFNKAVTICLQNIDILTLCIGSHNEESTYFALKEMDKLGISPGDKRVYFSQLYGMSDHISFNLAASGYNVTKYLPYGPVKSVIPYLIRRAEENSSIKGQMGRELKLISNEIIRRKDSIKLLK